MSKVITIFDCNFICQTVKMTVKKRMLSNKGRRTDVIYGFLRRILPICEKLKTDIPVFVWDSRDSIREEIYPNYKMSRRNRIDMTEEEVLVNNMAYEQFDTIRKHILPKLGFRNNYWQTGYEADDIMACIALTIRPNDKAYVVTRDADMLQILKSNVVIYDPTGKKYITENTFRKKYGIIPKDWGIVKAIAGCSTDEVKGIYGVGETTAIKYLKKTLKKESKKYLDIEKGWSTVLDNINLVVLPMLGCDFPTIDFKRTFKEKAFHAVCTAYGMRSLTEPKFIKRWKKAFGNNR